MNTMQRPYVMVHVLRTERITSFDLRPPSPWRSAGLTGLLSHADHSSPERARHTYVADTPPRPRAPVGPGSNGGPPMAVRRGLLARAAGIPGSIIRLGLSLVASSLRLTGAVLNSVGSVVLPGSLMHRLRGAPSYAC